MVTNNSTNTPFQSTKGDLIGGVGGGARPAILPIGVNNLVLTSDSTQTTGMKWGAPSGGVLQVVRASTASTFSTSSVIPYDDTIPQNTEGLEILTASITPYLSTSTIILIATANSCASIAQSYTMALFETTTANAIIACCLNNADSWDHAPLIGYTAASSTAARTYSIRVGTETATGELFINQDPVTGRKYGGTSIVTFTLIEVAA